MMVMMMMMMMCNDLMCTYKLIRSQLVSKLKPRAREKRKTAGVCSTVQWVELWKGIVNYQSFSQSCTHCISMVGAISYERVNRRRRWMAVI